MTPARVILFIDAQNLYKGARDAFGPWPKGRFTPGQTDPMKLGEMICSRPPAGQTRMLQEVRIYTGRPDSTKQPKGYGAHMGQCSAWEKAGATVIARGLRYPSDWPNTKAQEKGVDVALTIDFVTFALDDRYDVGIVCSTDFDLRPALEYVYRKFAGSPWPEVMGWRGATNSYRLSVPRLNIWCHWLDANDFKQLSDPTDYTI